MPFSKNQNDKHAQDFANTAPKADLPKDQPHDSEVFKSLQEDSLSGDIHGAAFNSQIPTQQNVPSPLPGQAVPTPDKVAEAQIKVADDQEGGNKKNTMQAQAEILNQDASK